MNLIEGTGMAKLSKLPNLTEDKMTDNVVTIDGPAASGKSSVSRELAKRLGWAWVSTGAFYRGLALVAKNFNVVLEDEEAIARLISSDIWQVQLGLDRTKVIFQGKDVTDSISQEQVGDIASRISHYPSVRLALLDYQRRCARGVAGLVAEGRDCGTVVFPEAKLKIYLTAKSGLRAERRSKELGMSRQATEAAQKVRDTQDSTRVTAPLQVPAEALVIDTSEMELFEVVEQVEKHIKKRL